MRKVTVKEIFKENPCQVTFCKAGAAKKNSEQKRLLNFSLNRAFASGNIEGLGETKLAVSLGFSH